MAKIKKQPTSKVISSNSTIVPLDNFFKTLNCPHNTKNLVSAFLILALFLTIPILVIATINQRDLRSEAQVTSCYRSTSSLDEKAPSVTIESPSEGSYLTGNSLLIKVSATDNVCVQKVSLLIDGQVAETFTMAPFFYAWDLRNVKAGSHVISARATDASDNITVASTSVFRSARSFVKP